MYFTKDDILKIQRYLMNKGIKDSEMPEANIPISNMDTISIVQDNQNKKISVQDFISQLGFLHNEDFINVTDRFDEPYITLEEAIILIPENKRKEGLVITFQGTSGNWRMYQFKGDILQFNNQTLWKEVGSGSGSGYTFIPHVSEEGVLSWTNNGDLENPDPVNIKGESGIEGKGITAMTTFNGISPSDTIPPDDFISSEDYVPIPTATNPYLWSYTQTIYSDGEIVNTSPSKIKLYAKDGEKGASGQTPNISIGDVRTGVPGGTASANITGTTPNLELNMTIPQGPIGPQGEKGEKGDTGPQGPKGNDGTGVTILGSYNSLSELQSAHPTGNIGDSYIISGDLYVWSQNTSSWNNVGTIQGPQGLKGESGTAGTDGISVSSIVQTTISSNSGGNNIITCTLSNGTITTFTIKNGQQGLKGDKGDKGQDGLTTSINLNGSTYQQTGGQISLPDLQQSLESSEDIEIINENTPLLLDRVVSEELFIPKGYKILRKNIVNISGVQTNVLTQEMINSTNTTYEIRYKYDLNGATITLPSNCVLKFNGGYLTNGILKGDYSYIDAAPIQIFSNTITLQGLFNGSCYLNWYQPITKQINGVSTNVWNTAFENLYRCFHDIEVSNSIESNGGVLYNFEEVPLDTGSVLPDKIIDGNGCIFKNFCLRINIKSDNTPYYASEVTYSDVHIRNIKFYSGNKNLPITIAATKFTVYNCIISNLGHGFGAYGYIDSILFNRIKCWRSPTSDATSFYFLECVDYNGNILTEDTSKNNLQADYLHFSDVAFNINDKIMACNTAVESIFENCLHGRLIFLGNEGSATFIKCHFETSLTYNPNLDPIVTIPDSNKSAHNITFISCSTYPSLLTNLVQLKQFSFYNLYLRWVGYTTNNTSWGLINIEQARNCQYIFNTSTFTPIVYDSHTFLNRKRKDSDVPYYSTANTNFYTHVNTSSTEAPRYDTAATCYYCIGTSYEKDILTMNDQVPNIQFSTVSVTNRVENSTVSLEIYSLAPKLDNVYLHVYKKEIIDSTETIYRCVMPISYVKQARYANGVIFYDSKLGINGKPWEVYEGEIKYIIPTGYSKFDTSINKVKYWTGTKWVDAAGADIQ